MGHEIITTPGSEKGKKLLKTAQAITLFTAGVTAGYHLKDHLAYRNANRPEMPLIKTEGLTLRALQKSDAQRLYEILSDSEVLKNTSFEKIPTEKAARKYVAKDKKAWFNTADDEIRRYRFAILKEDGGKEKVIGLSILAVDQKHKKAERSVFLDPNEQGKSYGPKVQSATMRFGFGILGLNKIYATRADENVASGKSMEKTKLKYKYTRDEDKYLPGKQLGDGTQEEGTFRDSLYYEIFKREWEKYKEEEPESAEDITITMQAR